MAPDSVPKSGTKIGAEFHDDSTSLDWKVGRFPDPETVPSSAVNLSRMHVIVDAPCPQNITTSAYTFLQCLMVCAHPKICQPSAALVAATAIAPHLAAQRT